MQADIRVIAATNQDLPKMVAEGRFREDLFYRINVIPMHLPPLRERREDIPLLAEHFLAKFADADGEAVAAISHEAHGAAARRTTGRATCASWRTRSSARWRSSRRRRFCPRACPPTSGLGVRRVSERRTSRVGHGSRAGCRTSDEGFDLEARGEEFYRHYIALALERAGGVQVKAAEMLGMSFRSFRYYVKKFNLR